MGVISLQELNRKDKTPTSSSTSTSLASVTKSILSSPSQIDSALFKLSSVTSESIEVRFGSIIGLDTLWPFFCIDRGVLEGVLEGALEGVFNGDTPNFFHFGGVSFGVVVLP